MIKELIEKILCKHNWIKVKDIHFPERNWDNDVIIMKCKSCGAIKKVYY